MSVTLRKRLCFSILMAAFYLLGCQLILPLRGDLGREVIQQSLVSSSRFFAGDFGRLSLFSLGLGPWLSALLVWQLLSLDKKSALARLGKERSDRWSLRVTLLLAFLQAFWLGSGLALSDRLWLVFHLTVGHFILIFLCDLNTVKGLGGPSLFILLGLIREALDQGLVWPDFLLILAIYLPLILVWERARYQIPLRKILLPIKARQQARIDLPTLPASSLPLVYAMTMLSFMRLPQDSWLLSYNILAVLLNALLAFVYYNPKRLAKKLEAANEYIPGYQPGQATARYWAGILKKQILTSSLYLMAFSLIPFLIWPQSKISFSPTSLAILIGILLQVQDQVHTLQLHHKMKGYF